MATTPETLHPKKIRWGFLSAGAIASAFAAALHHSESGQAVAVAARSGADAARFAARYGIARSYEGYETLLEDPEVDVVYLATPHPLHAEWAIATLQAGKHLLCEKPLTLNLADAKRVMQAASHAGRFLMEGYMYRFHPQTERLVELIRAGTIGEIQAVEVSICYGQELSTLKRLVDPKLGGGSILDVGGYCMSTSRLIAATAAGAPPHTVEPEEVGGVAVFDRGRTVDLLSLGLLRFESGIVAQLACGVRTQPAHQIRVSGTRGELSIPIPPWLPHHHPPATSSEIWISDRGKTREFIPVPSPKPLFAYEADHVAAHLQQGQSPVVTWDETLANMRTLDRWRAAIGLTYEQEKTRQTLESFPVSGASPVAD